MKKKIFISILFFSFKLYAFPEMIRHGYTSCTSCHVSPTGGGTLNEYGQELSKEALSTWGKDKEGYYMYNAVPLPEWLDMGGDIRAAQIYQNNTNFKEAKFQWMQFDGETAATIKKFVVDASYGIQADDTSNDPKKDHFISRRHFIMYRPTENTSVRFGRFFPAYGINWPDHFLSIKQGLNFDQDEETDNLEFYYLKGMFEGYVTALFGRIDDPTENQDRDHGLAFSQNFILSDTIKVGFDVLYGKTQQYRRQLTGLHYMIGMTEGLYLLGEIDLQKIKNAPDFSITQRGVFQYSKLGYELFQGFHIFASWDWSQSNIQSSSSIVNSFGPGIQFFPRPHFEFEAQWEKQKMLQVSSGYADFAYLLFHYYF